MSTSEKKPNYIFATFKLLFMVVLALIVVTGAFVGGFVFRNQVMPASANSVVTTIDSPTDSSKQTIVVSSNDLAPDFDVFWEAWTIVEDEFYGDVPDSSDRVYGAIRGMVFTFGDENTAFIDPTRAGQLREDATGAFEGIGASVRLDEIGRLIIAEPFIGQPAAGAGVERGDVVLEVDGQSLRGLSLYESVSLIRGEAGSTVVLTILREGLDEPIDIPVVRAKIEIEVVESRMLEGNIGYLSLSDFSRNASRKMFDGIEELQSQGAEAYVLDLRNNPGGLLSEAVAVSSLFLEEGVVLREQRKGFDDEQVYEAAGFQGAIDAPLVILVNRGSASASEIVAGAFKDNDRAIILGEQTFGKGTVQLPHTLRDGSELRVTIAEWFTPNGDAIRDVGVIPDIIVERTQADFFDDIDPQLDRAVEYLQENF